MDIANKIVKVKTWEKLISEYGMDRDRYIKVKNKYYSPFQEEDLPEDRIIKLDKCCQWKTWYFTTEMIEQIITEPLTKGKALRILSTFPKSMDIKKYNYFMLYDLDKDKWLASYNSGKSCIWYCWNGVKFKQNKETFFNMPKNNITYSALREIVSVQINEPLTKADLEKRLDDFKAELVNEHFPEVKEVKCIELLMYVNPNEIEFEEVDMKQKDFDKISLLYTDMINSVVLCRMGKSKFMYIANWNSGIDEQGRDWNK